MIKFSLVSMCVPGSVQATRVDREQFLSPENWRSANLLRGPEDAWKLLVAGAGDLQWYCGEICKNMSVCKVIREPLWKWWSLWDEKKRDEN